MREKVDNYKQFASFLLGNSDSAFYLGSSAYPDNAGVTTSATDRINEALFINWKRLFARDRLRKETFAMRFYTSASISEQTNSVQDKYDFLGSRIIFGINERYNIRTIGFSNVE